MLQTGNNPDRLQLLCNTSTSSSAAWQTQAAVLGINASCHLTTGSCKHVYSSAVCGVAGWFGQQDLQVLRQCMVGGISYTERDQEVIPALLRCCKQVALLLNLGTGRSVCELPAAGCPDDTSNGYQQQLCGVNYSAAKRWAAVKWCPCARKSSCCTLWASARLWACTLCPASSQQAAACTSLQVASPVQSTSRGGILCTMPAAYTISQDNPCGVLNEHSWGRGLCTPAGNKTAERARVESTCVLS